MAAAGHRKNIYGQKGGNISMGKTAKLRQMRSGIIMHTLAWAKVLSKLTIFILRYKTAKENEFNVITA